MHCPVRMTLLAALLVAPVYAQTIEPKVKVLSTPEDPGQKTVLVGRAAAGNMVVILEIEPAKAMLMRMGSPPGWVEHAPATAERYHVEVKPVDPKSKTRISYAAVTFAAVNRDSGAKVSGTLHPMWGSSGLHYAMNSALAGDGAYEATVTIGAPDFGRAAQDKDLWMQPVTTKFHFKLAGGRLLEVSEPAPDPQK